MNAYQLVGDIGHLAAILLLLGKLIWTRSARGVSGKTQVYWDDAVFYRMSRFLYHKFGDLVIFRSENLYSLCSPGNQH